MRRASVVVLALAGLLVAGCVPPPFDLRRPEVSGTPRGRVEEGLRVHVVAPFTDERARPRCRRNSGFTTDMAAPAFPPARTQILCSRDLKNWLAEDIAKALDRAGVALVDAPEDPNDPDLLVVQGDLLMTEIEPILTGPFFMNVEADYRVRIEVTSASGLVATRGFHLKSTKRRFFVTEYEAAFVATHRKMVDEIASAIVQLGQRLRATGSLPTDGSAFAALEDGKVTR